MVVLSLRHRETRDVLEIIRVDAEQLAGVISGTASAAERISRDVRRLDRAQTNAQQVTGYVRLISSRNACMDGLKASMDRGDYETAVTNLQRYQEIEAQQRELLGAATGSARLDDPSTAAAAELLIAATPDQLALLESSKKQLSAVARARCQEALSKGDHATIVRFVQLFPALGLAAEGIASFTTYLRGLLATRAREDTEEMAAGLARLTDLNHAGALVGETLSNLFRDGATAVEENRAMLVDRFGAAGLLTVARGVHQEIEARAVAVLRRFLDVRRIEALVQKVAQRPRGRAAAAAASAAAADGTDPLDPRNVEGPIEDLTLIIRRGEDYLTYVTSLLRETAAVALAAGPADASATGISPPLEQESWVRSGSLNVLLRELLGNFMTLEEYYMDETVSKAIQLDERNEGALTTSMVDDVFFLLLKSARRALASGSVQCANAVISQVNNLLCNQYRGALEARLQRGPGRLVASMPPLGRPDPLLAETMAITGQGMRPSADALDHAAAMNNLDVSSEYVRKLRSELQTIAERVFAAHARDRDRVDAVLQDLGKTAGDLRTWAGQCVEQLSRALQPQLRPLLDEIASVSYEITEAQYARNEADDAWWSHVLLESLRAALQWAQPILAQSLFESLVGALLESVATR